MKSKVQVLHFSSLRDDLIELIEYIHKAVSTYQSCDRRPASVRNLSITMEEIPTLDFGKYFVASTDPHQRQQKRSEICSELVDSLRRFGVAKLVNHGVRESEIAKAFDIVSTLLPLSSARL